MKSTATLFKTASNIEYFDQLPQILKNFFNLHLPNKTHTAYLSKPGFTTDPNANPFLPNKNPETLKYQTPKYSFRRQSVLFKTAHKFGIADLLPPMSKLFYEEKYNSKQFMRGVTSPKGHKYERLKPVKEEQVSKAMTEMNNKILKVKGTKHLKKLEKKTAKASRDLVF